MRAPAAALALLAVPAVVLLTPTPALADERVCRGTLGAVTVDDLRVPSGATCTLDGTRVEGNLQVERGATLRAQAVRVDGNVQGEGARLVRVVGSQVGGSVQVEQGGAATVNGTRVQGDLQYDAMRQQLVANRNVVGGNVQVVGNSGGVRLVGNRIDGGLQCKENRPAPVGSGNVAQEGEEGQCRGL